MPTRSFCSTKLSVQLRRYKCAQARVAGSLYELLHRQSAWAQYYTDPQASFATLQQREVLLED